MMRIASVLAAVLFAVPAVAGAASPPLPREKPQIATAESGAAVQPPAAGSRAASVLTTPPPLPRPRGQAALESLPAKELFGAKSNPAPLKPEAIGSYARGCLAGARELAIDGPAWQVMRLSRNRNWGHPALIAYVERLAVEAKEKDGWPGLLVGDLAQPRGGPMLTGHASHQIGLDADIWLNPAPPRRYTEAERETVSAVSVVINREKINPEIWTEAHARLLRRAASYPEVARIFVHPPIKKALCDWARGDRSWLRKIRPWWGHVYHFHVRLRCPAGAPLCKDQPAPPPGDGCGAELASWLKEPPKPKEPVKPKKPPKPKPEMTIAALPDACRAVLTAP